MHWVMHFSDVCGADCGELDAKNRDERLWGLRWRMYNEKGVRMESGESSAWSKHGSYPIP